MSHFIPLEVPGFSNEQIKSGANTINETTSTIKWNENRRADFFVAVQFQHLHVFTRG